MYNIVIGLLSLFTGSFYSLQFQDINGTTINMSSYEGKKVLIVNIATGSERINQLSSLQQLHQQYQDSLVVIAFPTNTFGNEHRSDSAIKQFCDSANIGFIVAAKSEVRGESIHPVFAWLASKIENGYINADAKNDFQKFLIDKTGHVAAVVSPKVKPMDAEMLSSINANYTNN